MREDSSFLLSLYPGPYKVVDRKDKYFKQQIGPKQDNVSVDWLKPVFSDEKVSQALPPTGGRSPRCPLPPVRITNKSVCFSLPSGQNPPMLPCCLAALLPMPLLGGVV